MDQKKKGSHPLTLFLGLPRMCAAGDHHYQAPGPSCILRINEIHFCLGNALAERSDLTLLAARLKKL